MTEQRTGLVHADVARVKAWLAQVVGEQVESVSAAERTVAEVRRWAGYQQHLINSCVVSECRGCETRASMLASLATVLPVSGSQREGVNQVGTRVSRVEDDRDLSVGGTDSGN